MNTLAWLTNKPLDWSITGGPAPAPSLCQPCQPDPLSPNQVRPWDYPRIQVSGLNRPGSLHPTPAYWALEGPPRNPRGCPGMTRFWWQGPETPARWTVSQRLGWPTTASLPWTTFPRATWFLTWLHFHLFWWFGGLAWGKSCICGGARASSGVAQWSQNLSGTRAPDPGHWTVPSGE